MLGFVPQPNLRKSSQSQIPILNDQNIVISNFGHWKLFVIWDLLFVIQQDYELLYL